MDILQQCKHIEVGRHSRIETQMQCSHIVSLTDVRQLDPLLPGRITHNIAELIIRSRDVVPATEEEAIAVTE